MDLRWWWWWLPKVVQVTCRWLDSGFWVHYTGHSLLPLFNHVSKPSKLLYHGHHSIKSVSPENTIKVDTKPISCFWLHNFKEKHDFPRDFEKKLKHSSYWKKYSKVSNKRTSCTIRIFLKNSQIKIPHFFFLRRKNYFYW